MAGVWIPCSCFTLVRAIGVSRALDVALNWTTPRAALWLAVSALVIVGE